MACMVESLGLTLPTNAAIPRTQAAARKVLAQYSGQRIVEMVKENLRLSDILTREAFENADHDQCRHWRFHQFRHPSACAGGNEWA